MIEVSYFEAWAKWLSGESLAGLKLGWFEILWWGRIGKLLGLLSGLTIVAEIIGARRLRTFGISMRTQTWAAGARARVSRTFEWLGWFWTASLARSLAQYRQNDAEAAADRLLERDASERARKFPLDSWNAVIAVVWAAYVAMQGWLQQGLVAAVVGGLLTLVLGYMVLVPLALLTINLALMLALAVGDTLVIRPIAWILERRRINTLIRIEAVFMLLVGFHFDLLAS